MSVFGGKADICLSGEQLNLWDILATNLFIEREHCRCNPPIAAEHHVNVVKHSRRGRLPALNAFKSGVIEVISAGIVCVLLGKCLQLRVAPS
jgi:hypothetical protein